MPELANRKRLLETAARVFAEREYHGATVKDIVDEAGVSVGLFYFYFKNKEDLLENLYDEITSMILGAIERGASSGDLGSMEKGCNVVVTIFVFFQTRRELAKVMLIEAVGLNPRFEQKRIEGLKKLLIGTEQNLEAFQKSGHINVPDVKVAAMAIHGATYQIIMNWLYEETPVNLTDLAYPLAQVS
ncbi:MAG: TetR/AcrR family transcriptional regulator [Actinobacteria bacterium]|nr:TetR/AcrR family transcriptional regulator [Actinomycetota bacterium]